MRVGSSPHVRGTPLAANRQAGSIRFIPACAGNARWRHSLASRPSVHPRMRGERAAPCPCRSSRAGSSPHARGTHGRVLVSDPQRRFIPACAGNAAHRVYQPLHETVHPRMRGERHRLHRVDSQGSGSSPHARGTPPRYSVRPSPHTVHPRMRGERASNKLLIYRRKSEPSDSTKHSAC